MPYDNAQKFAVAGMATPLAKQVGDAIDNSTASNPAVQAIVALTNSTGGTANNTVEAVPAATAATTDTSAASLTSTNAALTIINNDIADLTVKVNALLTALKG